MFTRVKTDQEIVNMRESGKMLATVLDAIKHHVQPGMTQKEVAEFAARELKTLGGKPAFLGFEGFPDVICISVNDAVVHGIPSDDAFRPGDIASFDFGVNYRGMITDGAISLLIGQTGDTALQQIVSVTERSMYAGIEVLKAGVRVGDIGAAIEAVLKMHRYGNVRELVGHGVGHSLHEGPDIPNYGMAGTGPSLKAGMTIAIEPMVNLGTERIFLDRDKWTIRTADGKPSAHFEHTILITETGYEILTTL